MLTPQTYRSLSVACVIFCSTLGVQPAIGSPDEIRVAVVDIIERYKHYQIPEDSEFLIEILTQTQELSESRMTELRQLAKTDPNSQNALLKAESEGARGGAVREYHVYYGSDNAWRVNMTSITHSARAYVDNAFGADGYWAMSDRSLRVSSNLGGSADDENFDPSNDLRFVKKVLATLHTGLGWDPQADCVIGQIRENGTIAHAEVLTDHRRFVLTLEGSPQKAWADARVVRTETFDRGTGKPMAVGQLGERVNLEALGIDMARMRQLVLPDGSVQTAYMLKHGGRLRTSIESITAIPRPDAVDLLRGAVTYQTMHLYDQAERSLVDRTSRTILQSETTRQRLSALQKWLVGLILVVSAVLAATLLRKKFDQ